jgi:hypothetical protein
MEQKYSTKVIVYQDDTSEGETSFIFNIYLPSSVSIEILPYDERNGRNT